MLPTPRIVTFIGPARLYRMDRVAILRLLFELVWQHHSPARSSCGAERGQAGRLFVVARSLL